MLVETGNMQTYEVADSNWYATQPHDNPHPKHRMRCVEIRRHGCDEVLTRILPPVEWGRNWSWNILPDGSGVYILSRRTW